MSNKTILFADDSATMRHIAEKTFAAEPYLVSTVPSGEGAIAKAKEIRPDIIIVDAGMPGFSGYDVCKAVRRDAVLSGTPVIIMSGVSNLYDEAKGKEAGITEHMKKPFDTGLLIDMVQNLIEAAVASKEESMEYVDQEEALEPVSEAPEPEPMPVPDLDRLSEPPIPLVSPVMRVSSESISRLSAASDLRTSGKQTQEYPRPSSPPPPRQAAEVAASAVAMSAPPLEVDEEETFGQEADFGDEPIDVEAPSDVPPLEFDSHDSGDHSGSFHVGTLAELAQMDSRGVPLESEQHDDAIEIKSSASSLASLGPRMAPKTEGLVEEGLPEEEELAAVEDESMPEVVSEIPEMPQEEEEEEPVTMPEKPFPKGMSLPSAAASVAAHAAPSSAFQPSKAASFAAGAPFAKSVVSSPAVSVAAAAPAVATSVSTAAATAPIASVQTRVDQAASQIASKVEGITPAQAAAIQTLTREIIERVVWEVVPDLAEVIIKEELSKLLKE